MTGSAGLEVCDVHARHEHVRTVAAWYATCEEKCSQVVSLLGDEVARMRALYLVGGAVAFEESRMGVDQIPAVKPAPGGGTDPAPVRSC